MAFVGYERLVTIRGNRQTLRPGIGPLPTRVLYVSAGTDDDHA
jgi:hypothetical protein